MTRAVRIFSVTCDCLQINESVKIICLQWLRRRLQVAGGTTERANIGHVKNFDFLFYFIL